MSATITAFPRGSRTTSGGARSSSGGARPASGRAVYFRPDATLAVDVSLAADATLVADAVPAPRAMPSAKMSSATPVATSHLHITKRGRTVVALVVIVPMLVAMIGFILSGGGAVASSSIGDVHFQHVTVSSGETLWQVAQQVAPDSDPRDVVADIASLNNLQGTDVLAGQSLAIPTRYAR